MPGDIMHGGVLMSLAAAKWAKETGSFPAEDLTDLKTGRLDREAFLADCMEDTGDDDDEQSAVLEYVEAMCKAAGVK